MRRLKLRLHLMRMAAAAAVIAAGTLAAGAQLTGSNKSATGSDAPTIVGTGARLVVETVVVKDKKGNPITGLTEKDFAITEDGVPQKIAFCPSQSLTEAAKRRC